MNGTLYAGERLRVEISRGRGRGRGGGGDRGRSSYRGRGRGGAGIGMKDAAPHITLEVALEEGEVIRVALEAEAVEGTGVVSEDVVAEGVVDPLHQGCGGNRLRCCTSWLWISLRECRVC